MTLHLVLIILNHERILMHINTHMVGLILPKFVLHSASKYWPLHALSKLGRTRSNLTQRPTETRAFDPLLCRLHALLCLLTIPHSAPKHTQWEGRNKTGSTYNWHG